MFKIVNNRNTDHHIHSFYSDGMNTIEEIVIAADKFGLKEITITDHSQIAQDSHQNIRSTPCVPRWTIDLWQNVHNDVKVDFGIEADILNENGDICNNIQGKQSNKLILSIHSFAYSGNFEKTNEAYENAYLKNKDKIICIGHPCMSYINQKFSNKNITEFLDINRLTEFANKNCIPLELNGANISKGKEDLTKIKQMLEKAKYIMINSDAHTLYELKTYKNFVYNWLEKEGYS